MEGDIARILRDDLASAFALLSRLPIRPGTFRQASSAWAWPVVGAVHGALAGSVAWGLTVLAVPAGATAALTLALLVLLSGGLHEDGLADAADGLFGGHTAERRLEIMKDSRIGSYGAMALVLVLILRWSALSAILATGPAWPALIAG
jgi:adenosylcobinamide-GDP ribazoletransferase